VKKTFIDMFWIIVEVLWYWLIGAVGLYILFYICVWIFQRVGAQFPDYTFSMMGLWATNLGALIGCWIFFANLENEPYAISAKAVGAGLSSYIATANFLVLWAWYQVLIGHETSYAAAVESLPVALKLAPIPVAVVVGIRTRRKLIESARYVEELLRKKNEKPKS
jgi:hypothetical protein